MKTLVSQIDLVIECRDYRIPLVSRNPLFEETLGERPRLIVYMKQDLGSRDTDADRRVCYHLACIRRCLHTDGDYSEKTSSDAGMHRPLLCSQTFKIEKPFEKSSISQSSPHLPPTALWAVV